MGKKGKQLAKERRQHRLEEISQLRKQGIPPNLRWWSSETIAIVTGSSRGIGFQIARQLSLHGLFVVIASRDPDKCQEAFEKIKLEENTSNLAWHQLDISDPNSINSFAKWVECTFRGVDILINNAAVNYNTGSSNSVEFAEVVMATNYFGTKKMIEAMLPLMRASKHGARILNVTSRLGRINGRRNRIGDSALRDQLLKDECLSEELIDGMVMKFVEQTRVKDGESLLKEWPQVFTDYSISKLAVNAYTRLMAQRLLNREEGKKIYINCYCPGWVKTAMTNYEGNMLPEDAADTGVWVVLMPENLDSGKFFAERRQINF